MAQSQTTKGELRFELPIPPALNHAYRAAVSKGGRPYSYRPQVVKRWQRDAVWQILAARKSEPTMTGPVRVELELWLKRERDIDSSFKVLFDAMEQAQVFVNDRQITQLYAEKIDPVKFPHKYAKVVVYVVDLGTTPRQTKGGPDANAADR
jgi:Holliday junction resolvase RusA-like endonuclease